MLSNKLKKSIAFVLTLMMVFAVMPIQVFAAEGKDDSDSKSALLNESVEQISLVDADAAVRALSVTGIKVSKTEEKGSIDLTQSGTSITAKITGAAFGNGKGTITIENTDKSNAVILAFRCTYSGSNISFNGVTLNSGGFYEGKINAGGSVSIRIETGVWPLSDTLSIQNISVKTVVPGSANVNVIHNSALGSISGSGNAGEKVTLTATPKSGSKFLAWTDENNMVLSTSASYSFIASGNDTLKALFANPNGEAYFAADGNISAGRYLHSDLSKAVATGNKIVLVADGTLGAGNYTVPSGVTVLIPKDANNTINTNIPDRIDKSENTYVQPTAYRTLRMAEGANITVKGNLNVAGTQFAGGTGDIMGGVYGPVGFIRMAAGSKITINSGANLYAWGYVIGSGNVEVLKGGTVYESFQSTDWRGGQASSNLVLDDKNNVFPMTQYYVQNIEVPMKINAGATEKGYSCTTVTLAGVQGAEVPFIGAGDDNLFTIDSGYLIKDYDEATDRQVYKAYGNLSMKKIKVEMRVTVLSKVTLDSSKYVLPITNNLTVEMCSGTINITQDLCFLPGSEIIIRKGASCNLANGKSVYVYDLSEWCGYVSHLNKTFIPLGYAPGRTFNRTSLSDAKIQIDGTVNASSGFLYTTKSGAVVTSTGTGVVIMKSGTATNTYQISQGVGSDSSATVNVAIPVVVAKLQNADGTTTDPAKEINPKSGTIYTYTDGKWVAKCRNSACDVLCSSTIPCKYCGVIPAHKYTSAETTPATCTEEGVRTYTCSVCSDSYTEKIDPKGHTVVTDIAVAPKCEETGLTEGSHCSECNEVFVPQETVDATGHTSVTDEAVAPKCEETGLTEGSHCSVCNKVLVPQEKVDATGHTTVTDAAVSATCTETGLTEGSHCSVCNKVLVPQEKVPAAGHKYSDSVTTPATCTDEGVRTFKCSECDDTYTEKIASLGGHDLVWTETKQATAFEEGESTGKCQKCDYTEKKAIAKLLKIDVKPEANKEIKIVESGVVFSVDKTTVSTMLKNVTEKSEIVSPDGKKVSDDAVVANGMKIVLKDESGKIVDEKLIIVAADVDCDGKISAADARLALRRSVGLEEFNDYQELAADTDCNGKVAAADAREILRASVGLIDTKEFFDRNK